MTVVDLHQHLWPEPFVEQLRRRTRTPYLRGWELVTAGEAPYLVRPDDHDPELRAGQDREAGVDQACVSLSAPLGVEALPRDEAVALIGAWHAGARTLPGHFGAWASVPTTEPDVDELAGLLRGWFVGLQLPATTLGTPTGWAASAAVLRVAELSGKPVFVHPGPSVAPEGAPGWWAPVVGYVAQLQ